MCNYKNSQLIYTRKEHNRERRFVGLQDRKNITTTKNGVMSKIESVKVGQDINFESLFIIKEKTKNNIDFNDTKVR